MKARATPPSEARPTSTDGFLTRLDRAAALSTPRKAQKMMASEAGTVFNRGWSPGLHEAAKVSPLKAMAPAMMARTMGIRPRPSVMAPNRAAVRAPLA
ncbi:hypothetical protein D3C85_872960 [compost metagenome]